MSGFRCEEHASLSKAGITACCSFLLATQEKGCVGLCWARLVVFETLQMHRADASGKVSLCSGLPSLSSQHELQEVEKDNWSSVPRARELPMEMWCWATTLVFLPLVLWPWMSLRNRRICSIDIKSTNCNFQACRGHGCSCDQLAMS
jgi:hypothetical protein